MTTYKNHNEIDFLGFKNREKKLKEIWRYSNFSDFYYRSNNFQHSIRVFYFISEFEKEIKEVFQDIDFQKIQIMSLVHDDVEIIIGDFQCANKLNMSSKDISNLDLIELEGIKELSKSAPKNIKGYNYKQLLEEVFYKNTVESQIVKFFDHLDALCEALHEFFSGNKCVTINPINEYGKIVIPFDYYPNRFKNAKEYYPLLEKLFNNKFSYYTPFEINFPRWDFENLVDNFPQKSKKTGYKLYDIWKDIILKNYVKNSNFSLTEFSKGRFYDKDKKVFFI